MSDTKITWCRRVASWRASGQTADEFAADHGLTASTLRWWASHLKREAATPATAVTPETPLVRMARVIRAPSSSTSRGSVVIDVLDLRTRVTVEAGVERETLAAVFGALGIGGAR
ncbi:MAG: IS66 family insertion sequence element accessory protein TnpA [Steroidobacteraceae bacterium]